MYQNETGIGAAVADSSVDRSDIFITTKIWNSDQGYDNTMAAFEQSMARLDTDYLDLLLIHWPSKTHMAGTWKAMEELYEAKAVRTIGVSNFLAHHLDQLTSFANVAPAVNQIEHHPFLQQPALLATCDQHAIKVTAWAPLMRGGVGNIDTLVAIGEQVGATPAQVTLRWMIDRGVIVIPKSARQQRIEENGDLFGFELTETHTAQIAALDQNSRTGPNPDDFPGA